MTTTSAIFAFPADLIRRAARGTALPVATILLLALTLWYAGTVFLNAAVVTDQYQRDRKTSWTTEEFIADTMSMERPVLPAPHQVAAELEKSIFGVRLTSKRNLLYHAWVTFSAAFLGFGFGNLLGIALAIAIVHLKSLERALLPWVIASQTVPTLAIAPMIIVVLGSIGFVGLLPKALISTYLCFFPVTIGMVKGLSSPEPIQLDLLRTYSASEVQTLRYLRLPASLSFLFPSMKVAVALAIVGAIVGELPTGAQAGLGARLLAGSYYGQTVQIWSALVAASVLSGASVGLIDLGERWLDRRLGGQR
ncbi:ABC transporter permease subunit [Parvibaculum sedimenti]|uniref:ABC transporter permease subunit n=1 Tax=Parvibaculum sedimenti TaxID=2608632 RepID=A0A6N6VKD6_9HYPH|nr:ABC transporter permease [Parvibaculum sedimenti]KAB7741709.1 ABC transporter permease subunit [Parvibaculum sedimenti]